MLLDGSQDILFTQEFRQPKEHSWFIMIRKEIFFLIMANIGVHVNFRRAVQFIKQEFFRSFGWQWIFHLIFLTCCFVRGRGWR